MMKKLLFIFSVALMLCATSATMAQKLDAAAMNAKMDKADADSENVKKNVKASTWINRGDLYFNSISEPTKILYPGVEVSIVKAACGPGKAGKKVIKDVEYQTIAYPYFTAFVKDNKVFAWTVTRQLRPKAYGVALESYKKAVELDPNVSGKVKESLEKMVNYYKQLGTVAVEVSEVLASANAFVNVCNVQRIPAYGGQDVMMLYYAGYMLTLDGINNLSSYVRGEGFLKEALTKGYTDLEDVNKDVEESERGNIYYYLYHCAYAQREKTPAKVATAKGYLKEGIEKYPKNESIFEGLLQIYTNEDGQGDPRELLGTIEKTLEVNPKNVNAWFARGRIYYALENYDECIGSFKKVVELEPEAFDGNFYLGLFYMLKGDEMLEEMKKVAYSDQSKLDADNAKLNAVYGEAIPYFEAAHNAKPKDEATLDYLKQLCFRLRDEPGIMDKYTLYNALYKAL